MLQQSPQAGESSGLRLVWTSQNAVHAPQSLFLPVSDGTIPDAEGRGVPPSPGPTGPRSNQVLLGSPPPPPLQETVHPTSSLGKCLPCMCLHFHSHLTCLPFSIMSGPSLTALFILLFSRCSLPAFSGGPP